MKILVTGSSGFIGYHLVKRLLHEGHNVIGIDSHNDYYNVSLKLARLKNLEDFSAQQETKGTFNFRNLNLIEKDKLIQLFDTENFSIVVHLAAQAGVRYSITNPDSYIESNLVGFSNILEASRKASIEHLVFASSSSVYGKNINLPFSEQDSANFPVSLYAATKRSNELLAYSYSHLYKIPMTGLRFFTVYGPWGRPDMAYYSFTKKAFAGEPIEVFNNGNLERDFTFVDDIVEGVYRIINLTPPVLAADETYAEAPYRFLNIGNNEPITLDRFIHAIETATDKTIQKVNLPMQPGDAIKTHADITEINSLTGFKPTTSIESGIVKFVEWFKKYHKVS